MRHVVGPVTLELPDDLVDQTSYVFEARAEEPASEEEDPPQPDRVEVSWEELPPSVTPGMMVEHQRAHLEAFADAPPRITEGRVQGPLADAVTMQADVAAQGQQFSTLFAAFRWSPSLLVKIGYDASSSRDVSAVFAHVVASVREPSAVTAPAPGYVTRHAGLFAFDLPAGFQWPATYQFATEDEAAVLTVTAGESDPGPADFGEHVPIEQHDEGLHAEELATGERALVGGARGQEASFTVERRGPGGEVRGARRLRRLVAPGKDRGFLSLTLVTREDEASAWEARWNDIVQSLSPSGQVP
jgi:hypothetical protein